MRPLRLIPVGIFLIAGLTASSLGADDWTRGRVTQIRKLVNTGEIRIGRNSERPAKVNDQVDAAQYVLTGTGALAEMEFNDASLVRVGQNTVFTFAPGTRAAKLDKGSVLYHDIDPDGHTEVTTPLLTCAVEGCLFVVQTFGTNGAFYLFEGQATVNGQKLKPGECLQTDGTTPRVFAFDRLRAMSTGSLFIQFPELPLAKKVRLLLTSGVSAPNINLRLDSNVNPPPPPDRPDPKPPKPKPEKKDPPRYNEDF